VHSKRVSQVVSTLRQTDMLLCDASAALSVANLQLPVLCLCRNSSTIVIADIASTSLVMVWLMYIIHVTLRENEEDAQNAPKPVRVSEFLKVGAAYHHYFLAAMYIASECHAVSLYMSLVVKTDLRC